MANVWLLQAFGDERQYAGNLGYLDDPRRVYRYDSFVPNFRRVAEGELAILRSPDMAIGLARIERIEESAGTKTRNRCPECGDSGLKERSQRRPRYRCNNRHEFDVPVSEEVPCTLFTAHFGDSFVEIRTPVDAGTWKAASERYNGQLAMQVVDTTRLAAPLVQRIDAALDRIDDAAAELSAEDAVAEPRAEYRISGSDERTVVVQQIRARRGQGVFRQKLLDKFSRRCAISGCGIVDLLEAAHISPYRGTNDHHPENGLLLRADLHTLFDLNKLGVEPETQRVYLEPAIIDHGYNSFNGAKIEERPLSREALESRWARFRKR